MEKMSPQSFVDALKAVLGEVAARSCEQWTLKSVRLADGSTEVLVEVRHPRVPEGTVIEYPV